MQAVGPGSTLAFGRTPVVRPAARRDLTKDESEAVLFAFETLDAERTGSVSRKQLKVTRRASGPAPPLLPRVGLGAGVVWGWELGYYGAGRVVYCPYTAPILPKYRARPFLLRTLRNEA